MNELALFAGDGGGLLGTHLLGWRPVCAVEIEPFCREVLLRRQRDGVLPLFPIWDDVRTFDGRPWRDLVDVVTGGFPCQPFSVAGKGLGIDDPRNMWPETIRVIRDVRPRFCLLENVPGLLAHEYFGTILGDLVASGFRVRWDCFSAASVGAPHRRDRLWIVADAGIGRLGGEGGREVQQQGRAEIVGPSEAVADAKGERWGEGWTESNPGREAVVICPVTPLADAGCERNGTHKPELKPWRSDSSDVGSCGEVANANEAGCEQHGGPVTIQEEHPSPECGGTWWHQDPAGEPEPRLGRVAHGVAHRVDRLKALGNGQVPAVVRRAWEELTR